MRIVLVGLVSICIPGSFQVPQLAKWFFKCMFLVHVSGDTGFGGVGFGDE